LQGKFVPHTGKRIGKPKINPVYRIVPQNRLQAGQLPEGEGFGEFQGDRREVRMGAGGGLAFNADNVLSHRKNTSKISKKMMELESVAWYAKSMIFIKPQRGDFSLPAPQLSQFPPPIILSPLA